MSLLVITDERCLDHEAGASHPERPDRLRAVWAGLEAADLGGRLERSSPEPAPPEAIMRVHNESLLVDLERMSAAGGGRLDPDTAMSPRSLEAAKLAAGSGLAAIEALDTGAATAAFCAVRPPGHHATPSRSMGFCLLNNVAIAAAALAERGNRVLVVDYDAHHGNGTQAAFEHDPRVMFVSFHQWPLYPGTGSMDETGTGEGAGTVVNVPFPRGTTGDHYLRAWRVISRLVWKFDPQWCLISAGFDAHRADPLTDMGLSSGDFADLTLEVVGSVRPRRTIAFLEGGYDLAALGASSAAVARALVGDRLHPEPPTSGGPGAETVEALRGVCAELAR